MKLTAILTLSLFLIGAVATPALADPGHDGAEHREARGDAYRDDHRADRQEREERHNATVDRLKARCEAAENRTGRDIPACDRIEQIHDHAHQARRAYHHGSHALVAWEHLNATLARLEAKFEEKLADGNLTENETAAFEAKLERIDAMQEKLAAKIEAMKERLAGMEDRWQAVRDHVQAMRERRGDDSDEVESEEASVESESDDESEDESEEESEEESDEESDDGSDGNETAEP